MADITLFRRFSLPQPGTDSPASWLSWNYSIIFPIALLALLGTFIYSLFDSESPNPGDSAGTVSAIHTGTETATSPASTKGAGTTEAIVATGPTDLVAQVPPATADTATPSSNVATFEGTITDANGKPIQGARITDGKQLVITGADGLFEFDTSGIEPQTEIRITASGYHDWISPVSDLDTRMDIALTLQPINALYLNPNQSGSDEEIQRYIDIINSTSANAVVIDIKEEIIYYDSRVPLFVDAGTVRPIMDLTEILKKFQDNHIYTIARLVVFKDGLVAQANPDMAVLNNLTGDLWRDDNGVAWVNPMVHELWQANADLAVEAAGYGFDEIQYDYVRFPTDGDFTTMDFGLENTQENREHSIEGFLELARKELLPTGVKQSTDVFGYTLIVEDDLGIGQNFANLGQYVDYLSPMVYPSHWPDGTFGLDGQPNDYPYETVEISMRKAGEKLDGNMLQVRPWLQDFSFFDMTPYGDEEVRAQIQAAEDAGVSGWMLWDPNNEYHPGAFDPESPSATPESGTPVGLFDRSGLRIQSRSGRKS